MKKLAIALLYACFALGGYAQNRVDSPSPALESKSKTLKKATYWEKVSGKWKSRKANKLVYEGEGVECENMEGMFIGEYDGRRFLFVDKHDYFWRYPTLKTEWWKARTMHEALLLDEDYTALQNIKAGESVVVVPKFKLSMSKAHEEYSFPQFLSLGSTLLSSAETMYDSYLTHEGKERADAYWRESYPALPFIIVKRVDSDKGDVVRFRFGSITELIDSVYFEVPYSEWMGLFIPDSTVLYK